MSRHRVALVVLTISTFLPAQQPTSPTHRIKQADKSESKQETGTVPPQTGIATVLSESAVTQPTHEAVPNRKAEDRPYLNRALQPEVLPNWLLFFVGCCGIYYAWKTLKSLENQAIAARDTAKAAELNAQAVIDSERAWIAADPPLPPSEIASGQPIRVFCVVRNRGKTVAHVIEKGENYTIQSTPDYLPETPDYGKTIKWPEGIILAPESEYPLVRPLQVSDSETWERVTRGNMVLFVFGFVKYKDAFKREHETRYIFRYETIQGRGGFYLEDKKEYNKAT